MSNPTVHAERSAKKWGGTADDYLAIHTWFDATKAHLADNRHRVILHSSFGIALAEQVFGGELVNNDSKRVFVREIAQQHVLEDLGWVPAIADCLRELPLRPWMAGARRLHPGLPAAVGCTLSQQAVSPGPTRLDSGVLRFWTALRVVLGWFTRRLQASQPRATHARTVINVHDGLVQDVFCSDASTQVLVIDWDTLGARLDEPDIVRVHLASGPCLVTVRPVAVQPITKAGADIEAAIAAAVEQGVTFRPTP